MQPLWLYFDDRGEDEAQFIPGHALALRQLLQIDIVHNPPIHTVSSQKMLRQLKQAGILRGVIIEYRRPSVVSFIGEQVQLIDPDLPIITIGWDKSSLADLRRVQYYSHWTTEALNEIRRHSVVGGDSLSIVDVGLAEIINSHRRQPHPSQPPSIWQCDLDRLQRLDDDGCRELKDRLLTMAGYEISQPGQGLTRRDISLGNDVGMLYHHLPTGEEVVMRGFGQHRKAEPRLRQRLERAAEFYEDCGLPTNELFTPRREAIVMGLVFYTVEGYHAPLVQLSSGWVGTERARRYAHQLVQERRLLTVDEEGRWFK